MGQGSTSELPFFRQGAFPLSRFVGGTINFNKWYIEVDQNRVGA